MSHIAAAYQNFAKKNMGTTVMEYIILSMIYIICLILTAYKRGSKTRKYLAYHRGFILVFLRMGIL